MGPGTTDQGLPSWRCVAFCGRTRVWVWWLTRHGDDLSTEADEVKGTSVAMRHTERYALAFTTGQEAQAVWKSFFYVSIKWNIKITIQIKKKRDYNYFFCTTVSIRIYFNRMCMSWTHHHRSIQQLYMATRTHVLPYTVHSLHEHSWRRHIKNVINCCLVLSSRVTLLRCSRSCPKPEWICRRCAVTANLTRQGPILPPGDGVSPGVMPFLKGPVFNTNAMPLCSPRLATRRHSVWGCPARHDTLALYFVSTTGSRSFYECLPATRHGASRTPAKLLSCHSMVLIQAAWILSPHVRFFCGSVGKSLQV